MNVLLVGTDGRDKITPAEKRKYHLGGAPCHCTDTIMLVHVSADRSRVSVVSLPRDSYAVVPEHTDPATRKRYPAHPVRLNAAYAQGGPQLTVQTVERMTGVQINHYLEVDFTSFMKTVDVLGGVDICTARPLKDSYTGLDLPVGTSKLDGGQALQYVRSRHLDAASDLGRMQRQQRFMASLIAKTTSSGVLLNPVKFRDVASTVFGSVRADKGFGPDEMLSIGQAMRGFKPASSEFTSVPIGQMNYRVKGIGSTVKWDPVKAGKLFREIREDVPIAVHRPAASQAQKVDVPPSQIRVQVTNGTSTSGLAARADKSLRSTGFLSSVAATVQAAGGVGRQAHGHRVRPALEPFGALAGGGAAARGAAVGGGDRFHAEGDARVGLHHGDTGPGGRAGSGQVRGGHGRPGGLQVAASGRRRPRDARPVQPVQPVRLAQSSMPSAMRCSRSSLIARRRASRCVRRICASW